MAITLINACTCYLITNQRYLTHDQPHAILKETDCSSSSSHGSG